MLADVLSRPDHDPSLAAALHEAIVRVVDSMPDVAQYWGMDDGMTGHLLLSHRLARNAQVRIL